ncbi:peptidase U32 family protein, partial [uncultured Anaerovibrio sp.]|uniref:peptidase U32 family protein n=1 Tax=uncultured Anaerovibrio sp. TaxID=361586 RepID=UPI00262E02A6
MIKKPELLAPAGNMEKLKMALIYGADAVYLGGKAFGLRAFGGNFDDNELKAAVEFAHGLGRKVYVTVNIFPHNSDMEKLPEYLAYLNEIGVDAMLIADLGVFTLARRYAPDTEIHISTQANNTNWVTVNTWADMGASRVVLAREMSLGEIRTIREKCQVELEMFVHGAMCISYSGRCLMSNYMTGRDANRGSCAQACRWRYALVEEKRPGQYFPIEEDDRGTYFFNSKDMCLLPHIGDVINSGVDSLKIEGRMKSVHYAASIVKAYREAIDSYCADPGHFQLKQEWLDELGKVSHRQYTTGFYYNKPSADDQIYGTTSYEQTSDFVGLVLSY